MDTDTWWHLRAGEWIYTHRAILQQDVFSYTRLGDRWSYPGWFVQVPMYLLFSFFGPGGLNIWTAAMVTTAFTCAWFTLKGGYFLKAFLLILAAAASAVFWSARPHLVSFVLTAATLLVLERATRDPGSGNKLLFWLPVFMLLWVNSHGGFALGFLLWGIYWIAEQSSWLFRRTAIARYSKIFHTPGVFFTQPEYRLTLVGLLMLVAACFNPAGLRMLSYPFQTLGIGALQAYIQEWQSPDFHSLSIQPFLWLLLLGFAALGISTQVISLSDFLLLAVFGSMGLMAGRNIALFALAAPVVIARHLDKLLSLRVPWLNQSASSLSFNRRKLNWLNSLLFGLVFLAALLKAALVFPEEKNLAEFQRFLPVEAVQVINRAELEGPLFNSYNWGGYLLWSAPGYPVFIDGRTDLYDDEIIEQWLTVVQVKKGWEDILDKYRVNLVINETGSELTKTLRRSSEWSQVYQDPLAVVFSRENPLE